VVRWGRRHRSAVVGAGVFLVSAVVALSVTTALFWKWEQKVAEQKSLVERSYALNRDLSFDVIDVVRSSALDFAATPALHPASKKMLEATARACRQALERQPDDVQLAARAAEVYRHTANAHRLLGESEPAEGLYDDSTRLLEGLTKQFPHETAYRVSLAEVLRDRAQLQARRGRLVQATATLRDAIRVAEGLRDEDPDRVAYREVLATLLFDLSGIQFATGGFAASGTSAARAADLFRELVALPAGERHPYDPLLLAATLSQQAVAERAAGHPEAASPLHADAARRMEDLYAKRPEGVSFVDIVQYRARCWLDEAQTCVRTSEHRAKAERNCSGAALQLEALAKAAPGIPVYRELLATAYLTRGQLRIDDNRLEDARADFDRARQLLEELLRQFPEVPANRGDLGRAYAGLAQVARGSGDEETATDWSTKAVGALQRAVAESPESAQDDLSLKQLQGRPAK
jgi:tetratricopeptide (TPR) repeat protein